MTQNAARRVALAHINMKIMVSDVEDAMRELSSDGKPVEFQAGMIVGLTAAKFALDGCTADEAWQRIEPIMAALREDVQG